MCLEKIQNLLNRTWIKSLIENTFINSVFVENGCTLYKNVYYVKKRGLKL